MIKCPGKDLEILISSLYLFDNHDTFARIEPSMKNMKSLVKTTFPKREKTEQEKIAKIACQDIIKKYVSNQRITYFLSEYGDTQIEIRRNMREHLKNCDGCRERYSLYLDEKAEKKLKWAKEEGLDCKKTRSYAQGLLEKGYLKVLKEMDILGLSE